MNGGHLSVLIEQGDVQRRGIAWRWDSSQPVPDHCDLAFRITENSWKGERRLQLEIKAIRQHSPRVSLRYGKRDYVAERSSDDGILIRNSAGETLQATGTSTDREGGDQRFRHPSVMHLVDQACLGLGLRP